VQCVWPQAPFEGAPFSMERPLFLDWRFRPLLGPPGRFGVCLGQLDRPTGGSGGRNFSYDSSASNGNAALGSQEPGVDSAHRGYRLSVLFHSFGCGYGQPVVVPRLQRRPILKTNGPEVPRGGRKEQQNCHTSLRLPRRNLVLTWPGARLRACALFARGGACVKG